MSETIKWNFVTQVLQGPSVSAAATIDDVDAYDKFDIELADSVTQTVNLVPGGTIFLLVINPKTWLIPMLAALLVLGLAIHWYVLNLPQYSW